MEGGIATNRVSPARRRFSRGQSLVEFAIASTVLFLILMGLIDFGRVYYFNVSMHGAAREGARHGAWFDPGSNTNPYLYDTSIKNTVNQVLSPSTLDGSFKGGGSTAGCPAPAVSNSYNNPPFPASAYPTALDSPYIYICYKHASDSSYTCCQSAAPNPNDTSWEQGDINVILLLSYGLVTGYLQPVIGNGIQTASYAHFNIQGSQP